MKKIDVLLLIIFTIISLSQEWKIKSHDSDKFLKQRKYEQALDLALQSLNEIKAIYGEEDKYVITQYGRVGRVYFYMGQLDQALEYYNKEKI